MEDASILTNRWEDILEDSSIDIVIELMGGIEPAHTYILEALHAGLHVVTANNESDRGKGQRAPGRSAGGEGGLLFEAAVAGGIPIIRPLKQCLAGNHMTEVMESSMEPPILSSQKCLRREWNFPMRLQRQPGFGYAEADPTADIEGLDAGRKIAILASAAFNSRVVFDDVYTEGITKITSKDIRCARRWAATSSFSVLPEM